MRRPTATGQGHPASAGPGDAERGELLGSRPSVRGRGRPAGTPVPAWLVTRAMPRGHGSGYCRRCRDGRRAGAGALPPSPADHRRGEPSRRPRHTRRATPSDFRRAYAGAGVRRRGPGRDDRSHQPTSHPGVLRTGAASNHSVPREGRTPDRVGTHGDRIRLVRSWNDSERDRTSCEAAPRVEEPFSLTALVACFGAAASAGPRSA